MDFVAAVVGAKVGTMGGSGAGAIDVRANGDAIYGPNGSMIDVGGMLRRCCGLAYKRKWIWSSCPAAFSTGVPNPFPLTS